MFQFTPTQAQRDLIQGFNEQLNWFGHTLTYSGTNIPCLMTPANPVAPEFLLDAFPDYREVSIASALRSLATNGVTAQTTVADEMNQSWTVIKRADNPSTITVEFWLHKIVAGVDTD